MPDHALPALCLLLVFGSSRMMIGFALPYNRHRDDVLYRHRPVILDINSVILVYFPPILGNADELKLPKPESSDLGKLTNPPRSPPSPDPADALCPARPPLRNPVARRRCG